MAKCVGIIYDVSGFKTPNTNGKDIIANANVAELSGKQPCIFTIPDGGRCVTKFLPRGTYDPMTKAACEAQKDKLGINACEYDNDYWAGAIKACGGKNKLPSRAQLRTLAQEMYKNVDANGWANTPQDTEKAAPFLAQSPGGTGSYPAFYIWSNQEKGSSSAGIQEFFHDGTDYSDTHRGHSDILAVCVDN